MYDRLQSIVSAVSQSKSKTMWKVYNDAVAWLFRLDSQEWFMAMCVALVIGYLALRGFGSRSSY
ncbi:MAG: hypothetical protein SGJ20_22240 [Planctomycetota bacterium]|nr:hypothetical protein [Planctomycetota bacterium]